jgi:integrase
MLTWDSYDINTGVLSLEQSKRRARVSVPLPKDLQEMLKQQHLDLSWQPYIMPASTKGRPKPYSLQQLSKVGKVVMQEANLPEELQLMDLRRTAVTEMVSVGVPVSNIISLTGHATVHSLTPYMRATLSSATVAQNMRGMI